MNKYQELEWLEAQKITISVDLVAAATCQLQFLAAVDRNRCLYEGPILERAIYRYQACWLPLLANYGASSIMEGPLVVPLDCEWIWHCHRLNPVRYKLDCLKFYGRILDNKNVESVVQGTSKQETQKIWSKLYPEEPYELDFNKLSSSISDSKFFGSGEINYDFVAAVKRQSSFFYQVSRSHMYDSRFLEEAVARYKGFLHLIKRNKEKSLRRFCVPTYDIDLIWHSHQLQPTSYCKDLMETLGRVLEHDDTDSDRSKGKKLDSGFSKTTKQWEETFGLRYWRAGAMYKGSAPTPVLIMPRPLSYVRKSMNSYGMEDKYMQLTKTKILEVNMEIVDIRNLPAGDKGSFFVSVSKSHPDVFFNTKKRLNIFSLSGEKEVSAFQCECTGEIMIAVVSQSPANFTSSETVRVMGTTSFSLTDITGENFKFSVERWFELNTESDNVDSEPISLHIAMSFTPPTVAPFTFNMVRPHPFSATVCSFPLPGSAEQLRRWTCVLDGNKNEIINLQMRSSEGKKREIVGVLGHSAQQRILAEFSNTEWSFVDSSWALLIERDSSQKGCVIELRGDPAVKLFPGRKLDFEPKYCKSWKNESDFMTVVGFSVEYPYGKALAVLNLKTNYLKVEEEPFVLPGIVLSYLLVDLVKEEGFSRIAIKDAETTNNCTVDSKDIQRTLNACGVGGSVDACGCGKSCRTTYANVTVKSGGCGGGCGGCGGGCGGCGSMVSSGCGGCGGGCGSGCGGCGGGCGNVVKIDGRGGCGGGCGSGGCGGCGGGLGA